MRISPQTTGSYVVVNKCSGSGREEGWGGSTLGANEGINFSLPLFLFNSCL